jgi:hypothetical protein
MAGHIDLMRERYETFNQGDVQGATREWADDFVWQGSNSGSCRLSGVASCCPVSHRL